MLTIDALGVDVASIERGMSTATMMSNQDRRFLNRGRVGPLNKRKEREGLDDPKPSTPKLARLNSIPIPGSPAPTPEPDSGNQLMAGYLAHEFLTKGTLFGQPWDPARAEAVPVSAESRMMKLSSSSQKSKAEMSSRAEPQMEKNQRYIEVADLLKGDGAHLPGIVNPTQLARSLQL